MDKVKLFMEKLNVSEEEAREIADYDALIDKGADPLPLTPSQKAVEKSVRQVARKVDAYGKSSKRERKADDDKREIISAIVEALADATENLEITNSEREINFQWNHRKFKIVLSAPRT